MRLNPLHSVEWTDAERNALSCGVPAERRTMEGVGNALATLVRHPALAAAYMPLSVHLKDGSTLPLPLRELIILRVANRLKCDYQWVHHVAIAQSVGLDRADETAVAEVPSGDSVVRSVLTAVDELLSDYQISDRTWAALSERLNEHELMDLVFTIGGYAMLAMAINSFGVEVEDRDWRADASKANAAMKGATE